MSDTTSITPDPELLPMLEAPSLDARTALFEDMSLKERRRVIVLDYVTGCYHVPPEDWLPLAALMEHYLITGTVAGPEMPDGVDVSGTISKFPNLVD